MFFLILHSYKLFIINWKRYSICIKIFIIIFTQWTSDQDITDAVQSIGVNDFVEVKFFENRANGQSKGFCVISLGSEQSMRICMERLPKKELHGQNPVVTFPTKQALNQVRITIHFYNIYIYIYIKGKRIKSVAVYKIHLGCYNTASMTQCKLIHGNVFLCVPSLSRSVRLDLLQLLNRVRANALITHINISHQCHLINSIPNTLNILNTRNKITVLE